MENNNDGSKLFWLAFDSDTNQAICDVDGNALYTDGLHLFEIVLDELEEMSFKEYDGPVQLGEDRSAQNMESPETELQSKVTCESDAVVSDIAPIKSEKKALMKNALQVLDENNTEQELASDISVVAWSLPSTYTYRDVERTERLYSFIIKEIKDQESAEEWLAAYSEQTKTTWRVLRTFPESGKVNLYKKMYRCQHRTDSRHRHFNIKYSKNTNCPAELHIIIRRFVAKISGKKPADGGDQKLRGYPAQVTLKSRHNHTLDNVVTLKYRDMSDSTKQKLRAMFRRGHTPSSAFHSLRMQLLLEDPDAYHVRAADGHYVPTISVISHLFKSEFSLGVRALKKSSDLFADLERFITSYVVESAGGLATFGRLEENYYVVLCTPLMQRVHKLVPQSADILIIESTDIVGKQRHRVYTLLTPSVAGALPLGIIITDCDQQEVFSEGLQTLVNILPLGKFYGKGSPAVILTENDTKQQICLSKAFPNAEILLNQRLVLKAIWVWLCDVRSQVEEPLRQEVYFRFKTALHATSESSCTLGFESLLTSELCWNNEELRTYLTMLWGIRTMWASCYRSRLPAGCSGNSVDYIDIVSKVLRECVLGRATPHNIAQMFDYLAFRFEQFLENRLLEFANGCYQCSLLKHVIPSDSGVNPEDIVDDGQGGFWAPSESNPDNMHTVDIASNMCTCFVGTSNGTMCCHLWAVVQKINSGVFASLRPCSITRKNRELIYEVATGSAAPEGWLPTLKRVHALENMPASGASFSEEWYHEVVDNFCQRVKNGIVNNPDLFKPAVEKMHSNLTRFASTEAGLLGTLGSLGIYLGRHPMSRKNARRQSGTVSAINSHTSFNVTSKLTSVKQEQEMLRFQ